MSTQEATLLRYFYQQYQSTMAGLPPGTAYGGLCWVVDPAVFRELSGFSQRLRFGPGIDFGSGQVWVPGAAAMLFGIPVLVREGCGPARLVKSDLMLGGRGGVAFFRVKRYGNR